jgi:hypothetical protein
MPELPESLRECFTPEELSRRVEALRLRFQQGAMTAETFRGVLGAFQFTDDVGHLWAPGANSGQWYRWDRTQWTPAQPPPSLMMAKTDLQTSSAWITTEGVAKSAPAQPVGARGAATSSTQTGASPAKLQCASCKRTFDSGAFCSECGGKLEVVTPRAPARNVCASCGAALTLGKKFCTKCGKPVGAASASFAPPQPARCPNPACGKPIVPGQQFCTGCGTRFA